MVIWRGKASLMVRRKHWISQSLFLYHHLARTAYLDVAGAERGETFAGFKQSRYASGEYLANICKVTGSRKPRKLANCLPQRYYVTYP